MHVRRDAICQNAIGLSDSGKARVEGNTFCDYQKTEGFGRSLVRLMGADVTIPDYTSLQKRAPKMEISLNAKPQKGPLDIVVDSTGLKVYGDGEWKARKHGACKRRTWRKIHIGIDPETGEIVAEESTGNDQHDADQVEPLVAQVASPIEKFYGDGAYDQRKVYEALECEATQPIIPSRKNAKIWRHGNSSDCRLPRDEALRQIRSKGRKAWKIDAKYHLRSLVETTMYRLKTTFGDKLRSRKPPNQKTEA